MTSRGGEGRGELHDAGEPPFLHWQNLLATQKVTLSRPIAAQSLSVSATLAAWHVAACDYKYSASPQLFDEISALPAVVATPQPLSPLSPQIELNLVSPARPLILATHKLRCAQFAHIHSLRGPRRLQYCDRR